jgi:hypothetical protein
LPSNICWAPAESRRALESATPGTPGVLLRTTHHATDPGPWLRS